MTVLLDKVVMLVNGEYQTPNAGNTFALSGELEVGGRINGIRHYPDSAADPATPLAEDGDRYYNTVLDMEMRYDAARAKWLSVDSSVIAFGRQGQTGAGAYFRSISGISFADDSGRFAEANGTVVSICYTRSNTSACTFEITADGVGVAELASSADRGGSATLNGDFAQGSILAARNKAGGSGARDVQGFARVRWRA